MPVLLRQPRRITITVSDHVFRQLVQISSEQGRSLSNLAAFLLERSVSDWDADHEQTPHSLPVLTHQLGARFDAYTGAQAERSVA